MFIYVFSKEFLYDKRRHNKELNLREILQYVCQYLMLCYTRSFVKFLFLSFRFFLPSFFSFLFVIWRQLTPFNCAFLCMSLIQGDNNVMGNFYRFFTYMRNFLLKFWREMTIKFQSISSFKSFSHQVVIPLILIFDLKLFYGK